MIRTKWKLTIDDKKSKVILHMEPGARKSDGSDQYELSKEFVFRPEELIEATNDIEIQQIMNELEVLNVCRGIHYEEIVKALNASEPGSYVIATGIEPLEGCDGWIELSLHPVDGGNAMKIQTGSIIDDPQLANLPVVRDGQIIATIHPPTTGSPGNTVTNEIIPPKPTVPILVQPGRGVDIIEDGTKIVATETGRPWFEQFGIYIKVSLIPILTHIGDVDDTMENIFFDGDVEIVGNVQDGRIVQANGNISVIHQVNHATLHAKQSVYIGQNVINSTIIAGNNTLLATELTNLLTRAQYFIEKLLLSIHQLMNISAFKMTDIQKKGLLPLIKLLLEHKFSSLTDILKEYIDTCNHQRNFLDSKWGDIAKKLERCFFTSAPNETHTVEQLGELLNDILALQNKSCTNSHHQGSIELLHAKNSTISCTGDVTIYGHGCESTKIHCEGVIRINGTVHGGELFARQGAVIKSVCTDLDATTIIRVPSDQTITIEHVKRGTIIQIGNVTYQFQEDQNFVTASLNKLNEIVLR